MNFKSPFFIFLVFLLTNNLTAQDLIIKNDKSEIKGKVIEFTDEVIKYKKASMMDGPLYSIKKEEVFMIVYKDGTTEYVEVKKVIVAPPSAPAATPAYTAPTKYYNVLTPQGSNTATTTKIVTDEDSEKGYAMLSTNDSFTSLNLQYAMHIKNHFYLGLDWIQSLSGVPAVSSYGAFLSYKYPVSNNFSIWSSAEYLYTVVGSFNVGKVTVPSSSSGGFTWAIGSNYVFDNGWGITSYTYEGTGFLFGLVYSR